MKFVSILLLGLLVGIATARNTRHVRREVEKAMEPEEQEMLMENLRALEQLFLGGINGANGINALDGQNKDLLLQRWEEFWNTLLTGKENEINGLNNGAGLFNGDKVNGGLLGGLLGNLLNNKGGRR